MARVCCRASTRNLKRGSAFRYLSPAMLGLSSGGDQLELFGDTTHTHTLSALFLRVRPPPAIIPTVLLDETLCLFLCRRRRRLCPRRLCLSLLLSASRSLAVVPLQEVGRGGVAVCSAGEAGS